MNIERQNTEFLSYRIPGLACTKKGSLLAYYECRRDVGDWAEIVIKIVKSDDDAKSWKEVHRIVSDGDTLNNPVVFSGADAVHMLYCLNYRRVFHICSNDDGETWSDPVEITKTFCTIPCPFTVVAIGPGHGIVTKDGTMVAPVWYAYDKNDPKAHKPSFVCTVYSKDNGNTWHMGELLDTPFLVNPSECALAVLKSGSVMISIRNENSEHLRCHAISPNGYSDWSGYVLDERFPDPVCQGSLCMGEGKIFFSNCNSKTSRDNLTVKVTDDDFKSFTEILVSERGGYSDIAVKDGRLFVLYEYDINRDWNFSIDIKEFKI